MMLKKSKRFLATLVIFAFTTFGCAFHHDFPNSIVLADQGQQDDWPDEEDEGISGSDIAMMVASAVIIAGVAVVVYHASVEWPPPYL